MSFLKFLLFFILALISLFPLEAFSYRSHNAFNRRGTSTALRAVSTSKKANKSIFNPLNAPSAKNVRAISKSPAAQSKTTPAAPVKEKESLSFWGWRIAMLAATISWGANFPAIKYAMEALGADDPSTGADGSLFVAARFAVAAACLLPFSVPRIIKNMDWRGIWGGVQVGLWVAVGYAGQAMSLELGTSADKAAFICCLQAVYVALYRAFVSTEDSKNSGVPARTWIAVAMAVIGVGFLELGPAILHAGTEAPALALSFSDAFALSQPICFGMSYIVLEEVMRDNPDNGMEISALQCFVVAFAAVAAACFQAGVSVFDLPWDHLLPGATQGTHLIGGSATPPAWAVAACIGYTGIIGTALSVFAQSIIFKNLPAIEASVILTTEPLWAASLAALLIAEPFGTVEAVGGSLILLACATNEGLVEKLFVRDGGDSSE